MAPAARGVGEDGQQSVLGEGARSVGGVRRRIPRGVAAVGVHALDGCGTCAVDGAPESLVAQAGLAGVGADRIDGADVLRAASRCRLRQRTHASGVGAFDGLFAGSGRRGAGAAGCADWWVEVLLARFQDYLLIERGLA